jgi:hypothetical protein
MIFDAEARWLFRSARERVILVGSMVSVRAHSEMVFHRGHHGEHGTGFIVARRKRTLIIMIVAMRAIASGQV